MAETNVETKGFYLHFSQCDALLNLPPEQAMAVIKACRDYCTGNAPDLSDPIVACVFGMMQPALEKSIKMAANGRKGGDAKASNAKQNLANASKPLANSSNDVANPSNAVADSSKSKQTLANASQRTKNKEQDIKIQEPPHTPPPSGGADAAPTRSRTSQVTKTESQEQIDGYTESQELREALHAFVESRRAIRKPLSPHGLHLALQELDKLAATDDALKVAIVNQSVLNGWQGLFPLKDNARASPESPPVRKSWAELEEERNRAEFLRITSSPEWLAAHGGQS